MICEWEECSYSVEKNVTQYLNHVTIEHLAHVFRSDDDDVEFDTCPWRDCPQKMVSMKFGEFVRHIFFHAFHVKIKCAGDELIKKRNLKSCELGLTSRSVIPDLPDELRCLWTDCEVNTNNPNFFYNHVAGHSASFPEGRAPSGGCQCSWDDCRVVVVNKGKLREHLRSHTQEKLFACPTCGSLFSNATKLSDHLTRQTDVTQRNFQCSFCNKQFASERILRDHTFGHVNQHKCPLCDMTCPAQSALRNHMRDRHTDVKPYECQLCDYRCKKQIDLVRHATRCHGSEMLMCDFDGCNYQCKVATDLSLHIKKCHYGLLSKYACHICGHMTRRGNDMTKHLKDAHHFKMPPGHMRYRYHQNVDGLYRLQTVRYETVELTQQLIAPSGDTQSVSSPDQQGTPVPSVASPGGGGSSQTADYSYNLKMLGQVALTYGAVAGSASEDQPSNAERRRKRPVNQTGGKEAPNKRKRNTSLSKGLQRNNKRRKKNDDAESAETNLDDVAHMAAEDFGGVFDDYTTSTISTSSTVSTIGSIPTPCTASALYVGELSDRITMEGDALDLLDLC